MSSNLVSAPAPVPENDASAMDQRFSLLFPGEHRPLLRAADDDYSSFENPEDSTGMISGRENRSDSATRIDIEKPEGRFSNNSSPVDVCPPDRLKTVLSAVFMLCCMICTTTALAVVHDRVPETDPLPDVIFDWIPQFDLGLSISEYLLIASIWTAILLMVFHRYRWVLFRRLFMITGILYFGRSLTMLVTALPVANTDYYCSPKMNYTSFLVVLDRIGSLLSGLGLSINGRHIYCGDYIYSGHTCMLVLSALVVTEYAPRKFLPIMVTLWLMAMVGIIMVSISRGHYTVDIILAYYVTTRVFWIYHTIVCHAGLKAFGSTNFLSNVWWFRILRYFESNVPEGRLPKHFSWPIPYPKKWQEYRWDHLDG